MLVFSLKEWPCLWFKGEQYLVVRAFNFSCYIFKELEIYHFGSSKTNLQYMDKSIFEINLSDTAISSYFKHKYQPWLEITIYFWGNSIQMITFHRMNGCWYFEWLDLIKQWSNSVVVQVTYYCCWIRKENIKDQLERGCLPFYNIFNNIGNKNRKWESDVDLSTLISIVKSKSID